MTGFNMMKVSMIMIMSLCVTIQGETKEIQSSMDGVLATGGQMANMRDILGLYTMVGAGIQYQSPKEKLKMCIEEYEEVLNDLEKNFKDAPIQISIKKSRKAWKPLKEKITTAFEAVDKETMRESAQFIHDNIRSVIIEQTAMKKFFLKKISEKERAIVNAAIEIGASSKRLSAHYMMKMWGLDDPTIEKHWNKGISIYTDSIQILEKSSFYKDEIFKQMLDKSKKSLEYFKRLWSFKNSSMPILIDRRGKKEYQNAKKMLEFILNKLSKT